MIMASPVVLNGMVGDRPPKVFRTLRGLSFSASAARALAFLPTSFRPYPTVRYWETDTKSYSLGY